MWLSTMDIGSTIYQLTCVAVKNVGLVVVRVSTMLSVPMYGNVLAVYFGLSRQIICSQLLLYAVYFMIRSDDTLLLTLSVSQSADVNFTLS